MTFPRPLLHLAVFLPALLWMNGCTVISVVDTAVGVAATAVKVTAKVAETAVDVTAAGVKAATSSNDEPPKPPSDQPAPE